MGRSTSIEDIIGIESVKLGFFKEMQRTISELKASNQELEHKRRDVQAILNGIPDVVAVISLDFKVLSVNDAFYETYGVANPEGLPCHEVFKGQDAPCAPCPILKARQGDCSVCRHLQILHLNGENRHIECTASLMRNGNGEPGKVLVVQRDLTLEKQYQAKYLQAERMATIGVLAEGVAHEINNPLTSISGFAEGLERRLEALAGLVPPGQESEEQLDCFREYLGIIRKECDRCSEIVHNMLTFGHREARSLSVTNLNDVVHNSLQLLHPRLSRMPSGLIHLALDPNLPCVLGHPGELMQVTLNLVLNALYAIQESGTITITTAVTGDLVMLRVEDTGHGIPEENLDKLFDPFFTTKPVGQGIGIGLSTCYNIIQKHGGDITVSSEHGKGATFDIILPYLAE